MNEFCAGLNCCATADGQTPHSSECQFEHMCAIKRLVTTRFTNTGAYANPKTAEAWKIWQWSWDAAHMKTARYQDQP